MLLAYHNDPVIKKKYIARVQAHREADDLVRGTGWDGHRGCAVGCTLEKYDHVAYETELGIPAVIAHLEDAIFEGLSKDAAMAWPERFLVAIKPGTDLSPVSAHFMVWLLETELNEWATNESRQVIALYRRRIARDEPAYSEWNKAARAAAEAARAAKAAAAEAAAAWAARAAAAAARAAAAWAAEAAAARAARAAAWAAAWAAAAWAAEAARAAKAAAAEAWAAEAARAAKAAAAEAWAARAAEAESYTRIADKLIELLEVA